MSDIKRYDTACYYIPDMEGEWVRWDDVQECIAELNAEKDKCIAALRAEVARLRGEAKMAASDLVERLSLQRYYPRCTAAEQRIAELKAENAALRDQQEELLAELEVEPPEDRPIELDPQLVADLKEAMDKFWKEREVKGE